MKPPNTLLATGGTGFVMSHVVACWLESDPKARALVVDNAALDNGAGSFFEPFGDRVQHRIADVLDETFWSSLHGREDIVHLVHGAAVTSIDRLVHTDGRGVPGLSGARLSIRVNIDGALNAIQCAATLPNLKRLVNVSSGSVYGNHGPDPLPEDGYVAPDGIYAATKYVAECFTGYAAKELGLPSVSVRLSGVFGPMDRETAARAVRSAPRVIAERALAGEVVRVRSLRGAGDFVYAPDVGDAVVRLLEAVALRHPVYNIAAGRLETVGDLLDAFRTVIPTLDAVEVDEGEADIDYPPGQQYGRYGAYDTSRIRQETGWQPRGLADAVADYVAWLVNKAPPPAAPSG